MKQRKLHLNDEQKAELIEMRDKASKPYLRERASAMLKVAEGDNPHQVATKGLGLLKPRDPDTVYGWLDDYEAEGIEGLYIREGRGRKPAFSPSVGAGSARTVVAHGTQAT